MQRMLVASCLLLASCFLAASPKEDIPTVHYQEGVTGAGNITKFELQSPKPMRIVLQSVTGDADIYVSFNTSNVSFLLGSHDSSSATCGLDSVDIPAAPRPAYLAIYGHPSHVSSSWRLLVIMGENSTYSQGEFELGPEVIYDFEDGHQEEDGYFEGIPHLVFDILELVITILVS